MLFAMVFSSIVGPNNYPPIEAACHDCPVILTDLPGHREQMGESALYFDKFNPNELADQIQLLNREQYFKRGPNPSRGKISKRFRSFQIF